MSFGPERSRGRNTGPIRDSPDRKRSSPYSRKDPRTSEHRGSFGREMEEDFDSRSKNFIKVSAASNVKAVAGKIAHSCRDGDPPAILTIGPSCINQAVKSVAIARGYLEPDGWDVAFQPAFRDTDRSRPSIALYLAKQKPQPKREQEVELPVSGNSSPPTVAGALAARVREQKDVALTAIGVDAVSNAVLAIGNARLYLEQDNLDIRALPEFVHVRKNGNELSAVKFVIIIEQI